MAECLVWHVDSETWRNAYMQVCTRAKMQKCKIANVLSCTISLGSERPKRYFRRAVKPPGMRRWSSDKLPKDFY